MAVHICLWFLTEFCQEDVPASCYPSMSGLGLRPDVGQMLTHGAACHGRCQPEPIDKDDLHIYPWHLLDWNFRLSLDFINNEEGERGYSSVRWMMLTSFIFIPQDFFFLRHSRKLLDNVKRCQCKPPPCLLTQDMSSLKSSLRDLLRAGSQVSIHNHVVGPVTSQEESQQCAWRWGEHHCWGSKLPSGP